MAAVLKDHFFDAKSNNRTIPFDISLFKWPQYFNLKLQIQLGLRECNTSKYNFLITFSPLFSDKNSSRYPDGIDIQTVLRTIYKMTYEYNDYDSKHSELYS